MSSMWQKSPPISFCTISPSRRHDPAAIWTHLDPVLDMIKQQYPTMQHFFCNGPATQYKQKGNFYIVGTEPFKKGFQGSTWNFFEASHGKGAPDGVGGSLKRTADLLVHHGKDIKDAMSFDQEVRDSGTQIQLHYVSEEEVESKAQKIYGETIKGTMQMNQDLSITPGILKYRDISCLCQAAQSVWDCPCHGLQEITLPTVPANVIDPDTSAPLCPDVIEAHHTGQWCIVNYDEQPYPDVILEVEEHNIKVKCMHRNGVNKFFWPSLRDDINWYGDDQIVSDAKASASEQKISSDWPQYLEVLGGAPECVKMADVNWLPKKKPSVARKQWRLALR